MAGRAQATLTVLGTVEAVEACWHDTTAWSKWVDGLDHVVSVEGDWPWRGATVTWQSHPAGRGRVTERVVSYQPQAGQALEVQDTSITGEQRVAFAQTGEQVLVTLSIEYELVRRTLVTPLVDLLFIRRAMASSLRTTLSRFELELARR
jgi:Polyketide cyclase / dehydrase and lipid transport